MFVPISNTCKKLKLLGYIISLLLAVCQLSCLEYAAKYEIPKLESRDESYVYSEKYLAKKSSDGVDVTLQRLLLEKANDWVGIQMGEIVTIEARNMDDPEVLVLLSSYYLSTGLEDKSQELCDRAEALGANSIEYYILRSKIHARKGENDIAIDQINSAILINRFDSKLYREKGQLYLEFGDTLSAINYLKKSMLLDTTKLESCILIAQLYGLKKDYRSANVWLNKGLKFDSGNMSLRYVKVEMYRSEGLDQEANVVLEELLDAGQTLAGERLIEYFKTQSQNDSVLLYANRLIDLDSMHMGAFLAKGYVFDKRGYLSSSLSYYEKAWEVDSTNQEALNGLQKVERKIAYLRKIKKQRESIPTFDFLNSNEKKILNK